MNDRVNVSLGLTLLLAPQHRGGVSESVRIDFGAESDVRCDEPRPVAAIRLYQELELQVDLVARCVRRLRRLPLPEEIAEEARRREEERLHPPARTERAAAPAPAVDDGWQGRRCDLCGCPVVLGVYQGEDVQLDGTQQALVAFANRAPKDEQRRPIWSGKPWPRRHACPMAAGTREARPTTAPPAHGTGGPAGAADLKVVGPWLERLHAAEAAGSRDRLDTVRADLELAADLTAPQRDLLQRAVQTTRAAIDRKRQEERRALEQAAAAAPKELEVERDPDADLLPADQVDLPQREAHDQ